MKHSETEPTGLGRPAAYPVTISLESAELILRHYIGNTIHPNDEVRLAVREFNIAILRAKIDRDKRSGIQ
jgi:hypothetical protein